MLTLFAFRVSWVEASLGIVEVQDLEIPADVGGVWAQGS